ncbi:MAG: hypothetical protein SPI15_07240 [Candidatus Faecousia sp.]|nr:hypothetical protein [Clostridiales bacterium]MDY6180633.1 hypothetical protein [Candidatus Faecousia sp.]
MEDYIRMLVEEEFDLEALVDALRERIRDELDYDYLAKIILDHVDIDGMTLDLASDNLDLPF